MTNEQFQASVLGVLNAKSYGGRRGGRRLWGRMSMYVRLFDRYEGLLCDITL